MDIKKRVRASVDKEVTLYLGSPKEKFDDVGQSIGAGVSLRGRIVEIAEDGEIKLIFTQEFSEVDFQTETYTNIDFVAAISVYSTLKK